MLCYSFRLILYVYGVLENDGQIIVSGCMMKTLVQGEWKLIQTLYYMKVGIGILLLFFVASLQAQNITGKVTDNKNRPVDGATIVLQAIDSTYINASISNVDGTFVLDSLPEEYRLIIQHLLYKTKEIIGKGRDAGLIRLDPQDYALRKS